MKRALLLLTITGFALYACSDKKGQEMTEKKDSITKDTVTQTVKVDSPVVSSDSTIVKLSLTEGKGKIQTHKNKGQTVYIQFQSQGFKKLSARLSSQAPDANVRIAQIKLPDGTMDGPFGQEMEYAFSFDGVYTLAVNENIMAGDPWEGDFTIEVSLKK